MLWMANPALQGEHQPWSTHSKAQGPQKHGAALGTHSPLESVQLRQEKSDVYTTEGKHVLDSSLALGSQINKESGQIKMSLVDNVCTGMPRQ